jgi:hypothetical protein
MGPEMTILTILCFCQGIVIKTEVILTNLDQKVNVCTSRDVRGRDKMEYICPDTVNGQLSKGKKPSLTQSVELYLHGLAI